MRQLVHQCEPKPVNAIVAERHGDDWSVGPVSGRTVNLGSWKVSDDYEPNTETIHQSGNLRNVLLGVSQRANGAESRAKFVHPRMSPSAAACPPQSRCVAPTRAAPQSRRRRQVERR